MVYVPHCCPCIQAILNVFREDPEYEAHEAQYRAIVKELLGNDDEEEEEEGGEGSGEFEEIELGIMVHGACDFAVLRVDDNEEDCNVQECSVQGR
jgi:hypothetical protein